MKYYEDENVTLYHGDSLEILPTLEKGVGVLLTDPPYFKVKQDEWDNQWKKSQEFLTWMGEWLDLAKPLIAANGSVWVFASPAMTSSVERLVGERFRVLNSIRWAKLGGDNLRRISLPAMRRFVSIWEGIIFAEQFADEWAAIDYDGRKKVFAEVGTWLSSARTEVGLTRSQVAPSLLGLYRNLSTATAMLSDWEIGKKNVTKDAHQALEALYGSHLRPHSDFLAKYAELQREQEAQRREYEELRRPFRVSDRRLSEDIWQFHSVAHYPGKHPCEKPMDLLTHMIETSSRPGWTILDPFAGSGSTLHAAKEAGRKAIGIEKDERYCEQIANRLEHAANQETFDFGALA